MQPGMEVPDLSITHNTVVQDGIEDMPAVYRMCIEAIYFERLSYGQLAKRMGEDHLPPRTYSRPYVFRLTRKARQHLAHTLTANTHLIERYQLELE